MSLRRFDQSKALDVTTATQTTRTNSIMRSLLHAVHEKTFCFVVSSGITLSLGLRFVVRPNLGTESSTGPPAALAFLQLPTVRTTVISKRFEELGGASPFYPTLVQTRSVQYHAPNTSKDGETLPGTLQDNTSLHWTLKHQYHPLMWNRKSHLDHAGAEPWHLVMWFILYHLNITYSNITISFQKHSFEPGKKLKT